MNLLRLLRTARHLRPLQLYGRVAQRVRRPRPNLRPAPEYRLLGARWTQGAARASSMIDRDTFSFLNVSASPRGWDDPGLTRLWRYNLHYFDDLVATDAHTRAEWHADLVGRWIRENAPGRGTGWEPYPTSLRIVNWIKWARERPPDPAFVQSLAVQARWLTRNLEWHILGNHLWANGKALAFAGAFFVGAEADEWLRIGLRLLRRELDEQILPDGGHFERSPMYHAIILEDVLDLINLAAASDARIDEALVSRLRERATHMDRWLRVMTHPDGRIAFFNDAAFGIAPDRDALAAYARRLGVALDEAPLRPVEALASSGYVRLSCGDTTIICDVAPVGPDYLPGHAHADTLSFEMSHRGQRVVVNGGTSTYEPNAERHRQRGTAAHSTVVVDDADSSEVWAAFRVARRARPMQVSWSEDGGGTLRLTGAHDGYRRLAGRVVHRRSWALSTDSLQVEDVLDGRHRRATAHVHLPPDARIDRWSSASVTLVTGAATLTVTAEPGTMTTVPSTWHPEFGSVVPTESIAIAIPAGHLITRFSWT